jgi:hypothetical protein
MVVWRFSFIVSILNVYSIYKSLLIWILESGRVACSAHEGVIPEALIEMCDYVRTAVDYR